jgi:hypothetical protein
VKKEIKPPQWGGKLSLQKAWQRNKHGPNLSRSQDLVHIHGVHDTRHEAESRVARWFIFKPKNPNLGTFWRALEWKMLVHFMTIWNILRYNLRPFGKVCGHLI